MNLSFENIRKAHNLAKEHSSDNPTSQMVIDALIAEVERARKPEDASLRLARALEHSCFADDIPAALQNLRSVLEANPRPSSGDSEQ